MATVICPNCGGENNITNKDSQECVYCGTMLHLPTPKESKTKRDVTNKKSKELSEAKFIVPIMLQYSSKEGVAKALKTYLTVQDSVPADIFDYLEIKTVKWIYLPMWRYNGNITTEWSCDKVVYRKRKVEERPVHDSKGNFVKMESIYETYEDYLPKSGHGHTVFDILVPAIKNIKEELPYHSIDFNTINGCNVKQMKDGMSLIPACASIREVTNDVDSDSVLTDVAGEINDRATECSYDNLIPRSTSYLPHSLKEGRECVNEHLSFKYQFNENGTVGELYYIPFVYVVYSYKGDTYEWGFMLNHVDIDIYDTPIDFDESTDESISNQKEKTNQICVEWNWFLFLSGVLSFLVGMIIFLVRNISLYERIGKRYRYQESMFSLLGIYKRRENLVKHGADKKTIAEINAQIQEEYGDEGDEDEDEKTPKSIAEIQQYFAKTEVLKQKLLKRMRRFWSWYISILVIVGCGIVGYNYYSDKMEQEQIYQEKQQLKEEICAQFLSNFQNKIYEGTPIYGFGRNQKIIRIKVLDKNRLEYRVGTSELFSEPKWSFHKIVQYTLDINVAEGQNQIYDRPNYHVSVILKFADYESINLLNCELLGKLEIPSYQLNTLKLRSGSDGTTFDLYEKR